MKSCSAPLILVLFMVAACGGAYPATSRVEHAGLVIEFKAACVDGQVKLLGAIINSTNESVEIRSGALPWQYDRSGTDFQAVSGGKRLDKNQATPLIGKTGPKVLMPNERREGSTPIEFIFPELKSLLRQQPVTITWVFPLTGASPHSADRVKGRVEVLSDPCEKQGR